MHKLRKGFSLIEITIVLAIAALIISLVFLGIGGTRRAQRDKASRQAAADVLTQYSAYLLDNNEQPPSDAAAGSKLAPYMTGIKDGRGAPIEYTRDNHAKPTEDDMKFYYRIGSRCSFRQLNAKNQDDTITPDGVTNGTAVAVAFWSESSKTSVCLQSK